MKTITATAGIMFFNNNSTIINSSNSNNILILLGHLLALSLTDGGMPHRLVLTMMRTCGLWKVRTTMARRPV